MNDIDSDYGCVREDDDLASRGLTLQAALLEKQRCGAGPGEQLAAADAD